MPLDDASLVWLAPPVLAELGQMALLFCESRGRNLMVKRRVPFCALRGGATVMIIQKDQIEVMLSAELLT